MTYQADTSAAQFLAVAVNLLTGMSPDPAQLARDLGIRVNLDAENKYELPETGIAAAAGCSLAHAALVAPEVLDSYSCDFVDFPFANVDPESQVGLFHRLAETGSVIGLGLDPTKLDIASRPLKPERHHVYRVIAFGRPTALIDDCNPGGGILQIRDFDRLVREVAAVGDGFWVVSPRTSFGSSDVGMDRL
ncbi:MAG: hypothetical protein AAGA37_06620 [Actinomycetota bacterium]